MMAQKLPTTTLALTLSQFGIPEKVLKFSTIPLERWTESKVLIKFLASPINPSDINAIQGVYPVKLAKAENKELFIPGFEGVARVTAVGRDVKDINVDDLVLPSSSGIGTWRREAICEPNILLKVRKTVPIRAAATIAVNPTSALRMLTDFVSLSPGSAIVQNAANSAVGQAVIQIAKAKGIHTINLIRDRQNFKETERFLLQLGANHVLKEGELPTFLKTNPIDISLALNAVGGRSASDLTRALAHGGTMITYGGMSKEPVIVPTSALIFKDIQLKGFWMTRWKHTHTKQEVMAMHDELFELISKNQLRVSPLEEIPFGKAAVDPKLLQGLFESSGKKKILIFEE